MNPDLERLHPYPFERLARLLDGLTPPAELDPIALSIGEPRHAPPPMVVQALAQELHSLATYPVSLGVAELREACARWLHRRYAVDVDPATMVLPLNGTREGLFAIAQAVVDRGERPLVLMPNPFYQIYEGAALLAGAEPWYLDTTAASDYLPDLDAVPTEVWRRCQLVYACSPANPTGAVMDLGRLQRLLELADRHDFVVAGDECYAEIYRDEGSPPPGLLQACSALGRERYERCVVFHSLSKRSNVPGLRSGFVAGDPAIMERFRLYRTYHGCAVPLHTQRASAVAWDDDAHVAANRQQYRDKFAAVEPLLDGVLACAPAPAAFYLWARTPIDDEAFAAGLYASEHVTVLPGSYLGRETEAGNPGAGHVRISLVGSVAECCEAAARIRRYVDTLQ